jgi:hypothetical protein
MKVTHWASLVHLKGDFAPLDVQSYKFVPELPYEHGFLPSFLGIPRIFPCKFEIGRQDELPLFNC